MSIRFTTKAVVAVVASAICFFSAAHAATLDINRNLTTEYVMMDGIRSDTVARPSDLVGAVVTANYTSGFSEAVSFVRQSRWSTVIDAVGMDFSASHWGFNLATSQRLQSLSIDLAPSGAIFDSLLGTNAGQDTYGTLGGIPVQLNQYRVNGATSLDTSIVGAVQATYSGLVQLAGHAPGADAFTRLLMDFSGTENGGLLGQVSLRLDMDVLQGGAADLTPIPLPTGILLLLAGLGAFGLMGMRQSDDASGMTALA